MFTFCWIRGEACRANRASRRIPLRGWNARHRQRGRECRSTICSIGGNRVVEKLAHQNSGRRRDGADCNVHFPVPPPGPLGAVNRRHSAIRPATVLFFKGHASCVEPFCRAIDVDLLERAAAQRHVGGVRRASVVPLLSPELRLRRRFYFREVSPPEVFFSQWVGGWGPRQGGRLRVRQPEGELVASNRSTNNFLIPRSCARGRGVKSSGREKSSGRDLP